MGEEEHIYGQVAHYFGLLADPTRLRILSVLCGEERAVGEVVAAVGLTQANISRHLNILFRAGVLGRRREGTRVLYRVVDPNFVDICRTVSITVASGESREPTGIFAAAAR